MSINAQEGCCPSGTGLGEDKLIFFLDWIGKLCVCAVKRLTDNYGCTLYKTHMHTQQRDRMRREGRWRRRVLWWKKITGP